MTITSITGCIGCEECVKCCPCDVIRMEDGRAVITYAADCQTCHLCRMYCPVDAIEMSPEKSIPVVVPWGRDMKPSVQRATILAALVVFVGLPLLV
jgi:Na+-translocating ferredoxin:NAD+ oxidoreductase RNF subunit RnfB